MLVFSAHVLFPYVLFPFVVFPMLLLLPLVGRQPSAAIGGLIVSSIAVWFTARGHGPFAAGSIDANLAQVQSFVIVACAAARLVAAARDERRLAERTVRRLAESERALAEAQRLTGIGSYEYDQRSGETTWSEELYRIFGVDPAELPPGYSSWRRCMHSEDREMVDAILKEAYEHHGSWSFVHRIVRPDDQVRVIDCRGRVEVDAAGAPVRILGTAQGRNRSEAG